jgi:hypothetical protein
MVHQRLVQAGGAVVGDVGRHALVAQAFGDVVGQRRLVLHDQHSHTFILAGPVSHPHYTPRPARVCGHGRSTHKRRCCEEWDNLAASDDQGQRLTLEWAADL